MRRLTRHVEQLLFSVKDVAMMIGFGRTKTYEMLRARKIPYIIVEKRIRVRRSDLLRWIDAARRKR
jgi:excisionase family DNA binding protein